MATTEELIQQTKLEALAISKGYINLDSTVSPAILAGILNIPVPMVYQGRQDGKLPSSPEATYREAIHHYINFYKKKMNSKSTSMAEAKMAQDIRNGIAKEELSWLEVKEKKMELLAIAELKDIFEPTFHLIRSSLVNLSRKHPQIQKEIDNMMDSWNMLGERIEKKAIQDSRDYVQSMLEKELSVVEAEEKLKGKAQLEKDLGI